MTQLVGFELVYGVGYVLGRSEENTFWEAVRDQTGIRAADEALRENILSHFTLRPWMLEILPRLRDSGTRLPLLYVILRNRFSEMRNWRFYARTTGRAGSAQTQPLCAAITQPAGQTCATACWISLPILPIGMHRPYRRFWVQPVC